LSFEDVIEQLQALCHQRLQPVLLSRRLPRLELALELGDSGLHVRESSRLGPMRQTARILAGELCPALRLLLPQAVEVRHRFQLPEQDRPQFGAELAGLEGIARIAIVGL
jgi:hypothetical protein